MAEMKIISDSFSFMNSSMFEQSMTINAVRSMTHCTDSRDIMARPSSNECEMIARPTYMQVFVPLCESNIEILKVGLRHWRILKNIKNSYDSVESSFRFILFSYSTRVLHATFSFFNLFSFFFKNLIFFSFDLYSPSCRIVRSSRNLLLTNLFREIEKKAQFKMTRIEVRNRR